MRRARTSKPKFPNYLRLFRPSTVSVREVVGEIARRHGKGKSVSPSRYYEFERGEAEPRVTLACRIRWALEELTRTPLSIEDLFPDGRKRR